LNDTDLEHLRTAIEVAQKAREHGNHPFGAILVDENDQVVLEAENTVVTERDCTGHAETNLMRLATQRFPLEKLATCTLYTSTEPCAMCAGAIHWGNVRRVVYALGEAEFYELAGPRQIISCFHAEKYFRAVNGRSMYIGPAEELSVRIPRSA
jgi:tRNA(Arg) A34 adenosine deaminase TadA